VDEVEIDPRCAGGDGIFVSNEGWLLPCCYSHIFLRQTLARPERFGPNDHWFSRNLDLFDLARHAPGEVLADPRWEELRRSWSDGTAPAICYRICGVPRDMPFPDTDAVRKRDRTFIKLQEKPAAAGETG
jgi:hypothetical protein